MHSLPKDTRAIPNYRPPKILKCSKPAPDNHIVIHSYVSMGSSLLIKPSDFLEVKLL